MSGDDGGYRQDIRGDNGDNRGDISVDDGRHGFISQDTSLSSFQNHG